MQWKWGDGSMTSPGELPFRNPPYAIIVSHAYSVPGDYQASVVISNFATREEFRISVSIRLPFNMQFLSDICLLILCVVNVIIIIILRRRQKRRRKRILCLNAKLRGSPKQQDYPVSMDGRMDGWKDGWIHQETK